MNTRALRQAVLGLALCVTPPAVAETRVSLAGGLDLGRISVTDLQSGLESPWRTGWVAGLGLELGLTPRLGLAIGADWRQGGGRIEESGTGERLDLDLQELTFPLVLTVRGGQGEWRPYAFAGPAFVWRRQAELALLVDGQELAREDITSDVDRSGWAVAVGGGLERAGRGTRPFLEVRYVHGLTGLDASDSAAADFVHAHTRSLQVRLGLGFGGGR